jgi:hypothetical protein
MSTHDLTPAGVLKVTSTGATLVSYASGVLTQAGLSDAEALRYDPHDDGQLLAIGLEDDVDGRSVQHSRSIDSHGRISYPPEDFEAAFSISPEAARDRDEGDEVRLLVHAGDGVLLFELVDDVQVDQKAIDELRDEGAR